MEAHTKLLVLHADSTESLSRTEPSLPESETAVPRLLEQQRANDLKDRLKRYLLEHPRNFSGAGRQLNISRGSVLRIVSENQEEFDDLEAGYLDELEEQVILATQGRSPSEDFSFNEALKVLERLRPEKWSVSSRKKGRPSGAGGAISKDMMEMIRNFQK